MTRELTRENSGTEYVQFRGPQTSVVLDEYPVRFALEYREYGDTTIRCHDPHPVVGPDGAMTMEEAEDSDETAIWHEVASEVVERNPMVGFGVACELCDDVFDTPNGLGSHMRTHADDTDDGEIDQAITEVQEGTE